MDHSTIYAGGFRIQFIGTSGSYRLVGMNPGFNMVGNALPAASRLWHGDTITAKQMAEGFHVDLLDTGIAHGAPFQPGVERVGAGAGTGAVAINAATNRPLTFSFWDHETTAVFTIIEEHSQAGLRLQYDGIEADAVSPPPTVGPAPGRRRADGIRE